MKKAKNIFHIPWYIKILNFLSLWTSKGWWKYLLEKPHYSSTRWRSFWCRAKGHPAGPVYYNLSGTEPNWHCNNCGDDLG